MTPLLQEFFNDRKMTIYHMCRIDRSYVYFLELF